MSSESSIIVSYGACVQRRGKFFGFDNLQSPTYVVVKNFKDRHESEERHAYIREQCRRGNWSAVYNLLYGRPGAVTASQMEMISRGKVLNRRDRTALMMDIDINLAPGVYDIYAFEDADDAVFFKLRFA